MYKNLSPHKLAICIFFISFYLFSRLTIDDSFINWMSGKNLVNFDIWNYNVTKLDLTHAYTPTLFALLSVIPNYLQIDIVLFFKLLSIVSLIIFVRFGLKIKINKIPTFLLIFFSFPATMIHIFSGMETFFFVIFLTMIYVNLYNENLSNSFIFSSIIIFIRPEAWSLIFLVPLYFAISIRADFKKVSFSSIKVKLNKENIILKFTYFLILSGLLIILLYFNKNYFGYILPNPAYVKIGSSFKIFTFLYFIFFCLPILILIINERPKLFIFILSFLISICFVYASSGLAMNYQERFLFHIFAPIVFFLIYISLNSKKKEIIISNKLILIKKLNLKKLIYLTLIPFVAIFFYKSSTLILSSYSYYPRLLSSYKIVGDYINKNNSTDKYNSISIGDAGLLPYNANVNSLDTLGLGSSYLSHNSIDEKIINKYNPKLIFLHAYPQYDGSFKHKKNRSTDAIKQWAIDKKYFYICNLFTSNYYSMEIYSFKNDDNIKKICIQSEENKIGNLAYLRKTIFIPPWKYWHH